MILREFHCDACNDRFESLMDSSDDRIAPCPRCGAPCEMAMSAPRLGVYNDPAARSAILKKRSHDDTMKQLKKEPEKYGFQAADKRPWNIRSHKKDQAS